MINDQQQRKRTHTHSKIVPIESLFYWTGVCKLEFEPFDATGVLSILRNMGRARRACRPRPEGLMRGRCARIPLTFGARSAPTGAPQALDASAGAIHAHLPLFVLIYASMCEACVVRAMGGSTASESINSKAQRQNTIPPSARKNLCTLQSTFRRPKWQRQRARIRSPFLCSPVALPFARIIRTSRSVSPSTGRGCVAPAR